MENALVLLCYFLRIFSREHSCVAKLRTSTVAKVAEQHVDSALCGRVNKMELSHTTFVARVESFFFVLMREREPRVTLRQSYEYWDVPAMGRTTIRPHGPFPEFLDSNLKVKLNYTESVFASHCVPFRIVLIHRVHSS
jgi:hypothetical protein